MARRKKQEDGGDESRWLTTYGDAVTLLLAFFVMLYAISLVDEEKWDALISGLEVFGNPGKGEQVLDESAGLVGPGGAQSDPLESARESQLPERVVKNDKPEQVLRNNKPMIGRDDLDEIRRRIERAVTAAGYRNDVRFEINERGLVVTIATDRVLFATGSAVISARGRRIVAAIAPELTGFGNDVFIDGHTDNVPLDRGGYTNWNLSTDRAVAVVQLPATAHRVEAN